MSTVTSCVSSPIHFSNTSPKDIQFLSNDALSRVTSSQQTDNTENSLFNRLEKENARLPPQDSTAFILAQIERQNTLLERDPKSIYIHSNELKAHFTTLQRLVQDNVNEEEDIDWGFWEAVIQDSDQVALKLPHLLSLKLHSGIPARVRGLIWQAMSKSASLHLETVYGQLCKEKSPHERIIQRDLARTFPRIEMFKQENGNGQISMKRILEAYSLYDSEVGYCQGLAFLVGPLLMNMPETQSFCVFVRLMETYEMRSMFTLHMEGLQLRLYQFSKLLFEILPDLSHHFETHGIHAAMYASQWFLTLFAYAFPINLVSRIYDIIFAEGAAETIMRIAIAILKRSTETILREMREFEDILDFVTSRKLCLPYSHNYGHLIRDAMALSHVINKEKLDVLRSQYTVEQKKKPDHAMTAKLGFWKRKRTGKRNQGAEMKRASSTIHSTKTTSVATRPAQPLLRKRWSSVSTQEWSCDKTLFEEEATAQRRTSFSSLCSFNSMQITSLPLTPKSIVTDNQSMAEELEKLRRDHQRALDKVRELKYDKEDLECERDALKLTILELERRYLLDNTSSTLGSLSDLDVANNMHSSTNHFTKEKAAGDSSCQLLQNACVYHQQDSDLVHTKVKNFELEQQCEKLCQELEHVQSKFDMVNEGQMALVDKLLTTKADMDELMEEKKKKDLEWLDAVQINKALEAELERTRQLLSYFKLENQYLLVNYPLSTTAQDNIALSLPPSSRRHSLPSSTLPLVSDHPLKNFWMKLHEQKQENHTSKQVRSSLKKINRITRTSSLYGRVMDAIKPKH
ncbi:hypothetical protein G6F37_007305 [Rhizopus arrhizus]|nr:hypothetical protein G6F38_002645 [Rhizopus arrhizus]KAG1156773.1 hypothetical protein G6F37_007305 [Rhizopus arrhizus]